MCIYIYSTIERERERISLYYIYGHLFSSVSVSSQLVFKEDLGRNGKEQVLAKEGGDRFMCSPTQ